ncbi:MAG: rRNA maturation RNase YbeY [Bacteroidota bacterium]
MAVQFFSADAKAPAFPRTKLKSFIQDLFKNEGEVLDELSYVFCSDEYLLNINRQFLNHDYYTDIITFDISETKREVKGEIYISVDRVKDNAKELKQPIQKELLRVIFHGALHLCGYKDKTESQQTQMRSKENYYLQMAGQQ